MQHQEELSASKRIYFSWTRMSKQIKTTKTRKETTKDRLIRLPMLQIK